MMTVRVATPGKLYLAGEYAVVEAGHSAVIAALNQFLRVEVSPSVTEGHLYSSQNPDLFLTWKRQLEGLAFPENHPYQLVASCMEVIDLYLKEEGVETDDYYRLSIASDLDHKETGKKYGLGSSGAVTVGVIKALLQYYGRESSPLTVFKLAAIAQIRLDSKGSFGDLAASSFGGIIAYKSLDREWLKRELRHVSIHTLLALDWKDLEIKNLHLPGEVELMVGWTGSSASTEKLVQKVRSHRSREKKENLYQVFLDESQSCVEKLITACEQSDSQRLKESIRYNRQLLRRFAQQMNLLIETPILETLCQIAIQEGAVAKSSGAGGGDCGICFVDNEGQRERIARLWLQEGIEYLPLKIAYEK